MHPEKRAFQDVDLVQGCRSPPDSKDLGLAPMHGGALHSLSGVAGAVLRPGLQGLAPPPAALAWLVLFS